MGVLLHNYTSPYPLQIKDSFSKLQSVSNNTVMSYAQKLSRAHFSAQLMVSINASMTKATSIFLAIFANLSLFLWAALNS